ncbi:cytochrome P450 [Dactylonectria macrodidyma]|uniref:Cytochrome P450 n=1 Tax=Dactylonectria macrodidyma TaxID=307937 RepID=A0A9P9J9Q6_9HYPO|nr:cytochrome P450 [Dactylonectria macrodidyma]
MASSHILLLLPPLVAVAVWLIAVQLRQRRYKLPPQVPGVPIFGNTFQVPTTVAALSKFALGLGKTYKDACTLKIGSQTWVVINSKRMYMDLLEKRPQYASRPPFPFVQDVMSGGKRIALMPYNSQWRELRKVMHGVLNSRQMAKFAPFQDSETKKLLWSYMRKPDMWFRANQHYTNSVIMAVVFGKTLSVEDPNLVDLLRQGEEMIVRLRAAGSLVDAYPFLSKLPSPLHWWRKEGQYWYGESHRVYGREVSELVSRMDRGDAPDCFGVDFLKATEKSSMDFDQKLFAMGTLMEAGSDTSRMTMNQTIAAAVLFPDWVERAREQLDAACGDAKRLPGWQDRSVLPYITATVKEALRWRPFIPLGVPHMLTKDDEYEGYKFPAGTVFTWNSYFMSQNEEEFEDPQRFYPDRFLNDDDLDNVLKGNYAFGPGRRVCVGYNVAEKNLWIAIARLVYCFDFEQVEPLDPLEVEWTEFNHAPFPVRIKPRSAAHRELVERECAPV